MDVVENVQCFGSSCFPVAFAIPAILMLIAIGKPFSFLYYLKCCANGSFQQEFKRCLAKSTHSPTLLQWRQC